MQVEIVQMNCISIKNLTIKQAITRVSIREKKKLLPAQKKKNKYCHTLLICKLLLYILLTEL